MIKQTTDPSVLCSLKSMRSFALSRSVTFAKAFAFLFEDNRIPRNPGLAADNWADFEHASKFLSPQYRFYVSEHEPGDVYLFGNKWLGDHWSNSFCFLRPLKEHVPLVTGNFRLEAGFRWPFEHVWVRFLCVSLDLRPLGRAESFYCV